MFLNHLKIAWRVFTRRKLYGIINLLGLSVGIGFSLLVVLFVRDEFKYDRHHENADRLYLLHSLEYKSDDLSHDAGLFDTGPLDNVEKGVSQALPFADLIEANVPEVERLIRVEWNTTRIEKEGKLQRENVKYVDPVFLEVFQLDFVMGDAATALSEIENVVITDEVAMEYFGRLDVIDELLQLGGSEGSAYRITGVIKKPIDTVFEIDLLLHNQQSYVYKNYKDEWGYSATALFVLLNEATTAEVAAEKIADIYRSEKADQIRDYKDYRKLSADNPGINYDLTNIRDLYLDPTLQYVKSSSRLYSYILISVAAIIVIIACLNYVAISISLASARSTEVALRKVMGSGRAAINRQFYTEAFLAAFIAILLGYSLMQLSLPLFNELAGKTLKLALPDHLAVLLAAFLMAAVISLMAGAIPARIMSRLPVVNSLKSHASHRVKPGLIKGMVAFQFTLCIFFIGMGLTMREQFAYINEKDLGFDQEQLVYLSNAWGISDKLKQELDKSPSIAHSAGVSGLFGGGGSRGRIVINGKEHSVRFVSADYGFVETLGLELVKGRDFDRTRNSENESARMIVNQTLYELYASDSVYQKELDKVIGVVKDFNYQSLVNDIGPVSFQLREPRFIGSVFAKIRPGKTKEGLAALKTAYETVAPNRMGEPRFIDRFIENQYDSFHRWGKIINLAAIITVLIAASGLFGLTAINVMNRMKEMGIRKVLGAGLSHLLLMLNRQTLVLLLAAMLMAFPLWYHFSTTWIESFAYHINLGIGLFFGASLFCLFIVFFTMAFHGFKTSRINPTQLLRDE